MIKTFFTDTLLWKEQTKHISKKTRFLKQGENVENNKIFRSNKLTYGIK